MLFLTSLLLYATVTFAVLACIPILFFRNQETNTVTLADMRYCERRIRDKYQKYTEKNRITDNKQNIEKLNIEQLATSLSLRMEVASDLPEGTRARLDTAPSNSKYNGVVRYVRNGHKDYDSNFDIIHEIMHYLNDVGVGKQVTKSFTRLHHGNKRKYHEQVIDYYAAAVAIPKESLQMRIRLHNGNPYDECFVNQLADIYEQPKEMIIRRIGEVIALS